MAEQRLGELVGVGHQPLSAGEEGFLAVLAAWFTAPFLPLPPGPTAALAAGGATAGPPDAPTAVPRALGRVVRSLAAGAGAGAGDGDGDAVALVDRYHAGARGTLRPGALAAAATTVSADRPGSVTLHFGDGTAVATTPSDLVALLLTRVLLGPVPAAAADGLSGLLGRFRPGPGPTHRTGVAALLPFPVGRAERTTLARATAVAVTAGAYPIVGAMVPEAAAVMVPVVGDGAAFLAATPTTGSVVPAGVRGRATLRLSPMVRSPLRETSAAGRRTAAHALRRTKHVLTSRPAATALGRVGIDVEARRGLVTRLEVPLTTNPWLARAEWRILDPGADDDVVVRTEDPA